MAIDKAELESLLDRQGVGSRTKKKILQGLDPSQAAAPRTSAGHGAAGVDETVVPSI